MNEGLLISILYALLATNHLFVGVPESFIIDSFSWIIFHAIKAFLIFVSLIMYLCVSKCYHYCLRDEVVIEQFLVEEIYERELNHAEHLEQEKGNERSLLIRSSKVPRKHGALNCTVQ